MTFDVFNIDATDTLKVKEDSLLEKSDEPDHVFMDKVKEINDHLEGMQKIMRDDLNISELRVAAQAVEEELESSIPAEFKEAYDKTENWSDASAVLSSNILETVQNMVKEVAGEYKATDRLKKIIDITDSESWTGSLSASEAKDVLKAVRDSRSESSWGESVSENAVRGLRGDNIDAKLDRIKKQANVQ